MWTIFKDSKTADYYKRKDWRVALIETGKDEAIKIFQKKFNVDPLMKTCTCCAQDYELTEHKDEQPLSKLLQDLAVDTGVMIVYKEDF